MHTVANRRGERRHEDRYERTEAEVSLLGPGGAALEPDTVLIDLSRRGLGLETGTPLRPGETVGFRIKLPSGPIGGTAEVRWMRSHRRGFRCGARIRSLSWFHARRIDSFLRAGDPGLSPIWESLAGLCAVALALFFIAQVYGISPEALWKRLWEIAGR